ncbi:MAG: hypothetical protein R3B13_03345 [Polyangiaceae bacterium]
MKAAVSASALLLFTCLVAPGCAAEMAPEDEAFMQGEGSDPGVDNGATDPSDDETVAESSAALCSCATWLNCSNGQVTVYEHADCCGGNFYFCPGEYRDLRNFTNNLFWLANWNDRISRIHTSDKVGVYVYQHVNFGGDRRYFPPNSDVNLGGSLWNDKISSLKVIKVR